MGKSGAKKGKKSTEVASTASHEQLPLFDEDALSALTGKIEAGFQTAKTAPTTKPKEEPAKPKKSKSKTVSVPLKENKPINGKKRDSNGNVKISTKADGSTSKKANGGKAPRIDRETLLQEILAMGGTEEDLDLIGDVDSDEEVDGDQQTSHGSLAKELSTLAKELGIASQSNIEEEDSEYDEEEDLPSEKAVTPPPTEPSPVLDIKKRPEEPRQKKDVNRLVFEARPDWHAALLPDLPTPMLSEEVSQLETIQKLHAHAMSLLEADNALYASKHLSSTSSHRFLATIMSSGTLSDKVSALTLVIQESPVHTIKSFESLLALSKKRSRGQAVSALGALKDLLGSGVVLPADRRLRSFAKQPGLLGTLQTEPMRHWKSGDPIPGEITEAHLISWAFEDWLKEQYFDMLKVLEGWCNDEVEFARQRAVTFVYELLREKPEQETNLLRLLVNKLGDPEKKIASRTSYLILQLQTTHPNMKPIIINAIESELLLRPNQSAHARYYAINTLNQTILSAKEEQVARKLLSIYFPLFVTTLKKPEPVKELEGPKINKKGQVQGGGGKMGKKAEDKATKELQAKLASEETTEKMISAILTGVNRAYPFAGSDDTTIEEHMDMLFKITHSSNFNTSIQALMLIQQLVSSKNVATERFYRTLYESLLDPRLVNSSKHALYLNLLFRALKSDLNLKRVKAFVKRICQIISIHQPPFICGCLYLIRELEGTFPSLTSMLNTGEEHEDLDEEVFRDVPEDSADESRIHPDRVIKAVDANAYDGRKRDPEHSNAERSCLWELVPLIAHFHPSVSMFAARLMEGNKMPAKPDLASHTLSHFLDRFVYRNAKSSAGGLRGSSIMQPLAGSESKSAFISSSSRTAQQSAPVNSEAFWRKKAEDVAVDEVFFHKYFDQIGKTRTSSKKSKYNKKAGADDGSVNEEDEAEDEIWQALVDSRPEIEGQSDEDSDMEMLDLDDSDEENSSAEEDDQLVAGDDTEDVSNLFEDDEEEIEDGSDAEEAMFDDDDNDEAEVSADEEALFAAELQTAQPAADPEKETSRSKKRRMKSLPTFASADDYATMLEDDDAEDR